VQLEIFAQMSGLQSRLTIAAAHQSDLHFAERSRLTGQSIRTPSGGNAGTGS